ncbi:D-amino acid dehydrogenase [Novosphingobium sp. 9U]|uniref:D-amino acid dehydrogenase n=1 Tax=Novosphingobium sp. 9U TaxID=2653158 RepID=UPI0012F4663E|nr:D-amino acid dehydrogenase [Novosphingobium sp. 9U]VWX54579.1 D-amino acid dehydrogenase 3 [Novosphingobium sp. 9U]
MASILVIGAGITGVTTAYALLERGHTVIIVDRLRYPAMETSFANGGQLSASNAEVWNSWGTVAKGLRWMLRANAPLLFNPRPSWHKYSWMAEFCGHILNHRRHTIETTQLAIAAREHLFRTAEREGIEFDLERRGILHLYHNRAAFDQAAAGNALLREGGLERYAVTSEEIAAIEPTLHGPFSGGYFTPSDSTGDIHKFTRGLAAACERRGARIVIDAQVEDVEPGNGHVTTKIVAASIDSEAIVTDAVVVCAGVASRTIAARLGDRINIYPVKGYSVTVCLDDSQSQASAPTVSLLDEDAKIVTSRLGRNRFRIAGTAEFNGMNKDIRADRIAPLTRWCERLFPNVSTSSVIPWTGLRPMTPTMLPHVCRGRRNGVFYNTGHGHLGWTLSAATAELVAEQVEHHFRVRAS